jgi:hypothetical protein
MSEPNFMKLGMYIMAPEPISTAYFINPSHQFVCLYVSLPTVAMQRLGKHVLAARNTRNSRRIVGRVVIYAEVSRLFLPKISFYLIFILIMLGEVYNLWSFTLCNFLLSLHISQVSIIFSELYSKAREVCFIISF